MKERRIPRLLVRFYQFSVGLKLLNVTPRWKMLVDLFICSKQRVFLAVLIWAAKVKFRVIFLDLPIKCKSKHLSFHKDVYIVAALEVGWGRGCPFEAVWAVTDWNDSRQYKTEHPKISFDISFFFFSLCRHDAATQRDEPWICPRVE